MLTNDLLNVIRDLENQVPTRANAKSVTYTVGGINSTIRKLLDVHNSLLVIERHVLTPK